MPFLMVMINVIVALKGMKCTAVMVRDIIIKIKVMLTHSARRGFTIVELLIVVVVIAILAAITVVSYAGITERAENTGTVAQVRSWSDALTVHKIQQGSFPSAAFDYSCLGYASDYPAAGPFQAGQCMNATTWGVSVDDGLMTQIAKVGSISDAKYLKTYALSDGSYRGIMYLSRNGGTGLTYVLRGLDSTCLSGDTASNLSGHTVCQRVLEGDPYGGL